MGCGCKEAALIPAERWQAAQDAERTYWYTQDTATQAARRAEELQRAQWITELLGITPASVAGRTVLDIGGGPQPIVAWPTLPLARRILLEPMPIGFDDVASWGAVEWVKEPAESYVGPQVDEVWCYNVLQHVQCPRLVLECAKRHAAQRIRWFEWVYQPTSVVHPHTITPGTFSPLAAWRRVSWTEGTRDEGRGWRQQYVAGVWERA